MDAVEKTTFIRMTEDGRKVEVIGQAIYLDGHKEATELVHLKDHPNVMAIIQAVPNATHMAGRIPLTAEESVIAKKALDQAKLDYDNSPKGIAERIRTSIAKAMANVD